MGLFGNSGGRYPRGAAGLGARLGQALRGYNDPNAPQPSRGREPRGAAGRGARLGRMLRGR